MTDREDWACARDAIKQVLGSVTPGATFSLDERLLAIRALQDAAATGVLKAEAGKSVRISGLDTGGPGKCDAPLFNVPIRSEVWRIAPHPDPQSVASWEAGHLVCQPTPAIQLRLADIIFARDDLSRLWPEPAMIANTAPDARSNKGGRNNDKHGEPIAMLTIHLLDLPEAALNRETGETLGPILREHYKRVGAAPPSDDNAIGIARGVLRTVKRRRAEHKT